jgi:hypothetical protein
MLLADAVAAYVEGLTERELDAPLIALLYRLGFDRIHLVHGSFEFGKDFIARRIEGGIEYQYCLQSKAGDLGAPGWRDVRQQVDAMRTGSVVHPDFDPSLPRRLIVVTNGRLKGGAGIEFQDYNSHVVERGEVPAELWDIDFLVPNFLTVLVEGVPAQDRARTLELLGTLGQGRGTRRDVREYARTWIDEPRAGTSERWGHVLTGAMLAKAAAAQGREDLANQIAFLLVRAAWENPVVGGAVSEAEVSVARRIFVTHATEFWEHVREADPLALTTRSRGGLDAFVTHPVKSARLCESLALLAIHSMTDGEVEAAREIAVYLERFVGASPGVAHLVSDEWAFSLLVTVIVLAATGHEATARSLLRDSTVWLLDWVEHGTGVGGVGEPADETLRQLLGAPYPKLKRPLQSSAYGFAVVADMAYVCGFTDLFEDIVNDLYAVGAIASLVVDAGAGHVDLVARVSYAVEGPPATHHEVPPTVSRPGAAGALFDCITNWATMRDRHLPSVIAALLAATTGSRLDRTVGPVKEPTRR